MHRRSDTARYYVSLLLLVFSTFFAGVVLERTGLLPGSVGPAPPGAGKSFRSFWEAWYLVDKFYVDRDAVDPDKMTYGAIDGMLASLGDVGHTGFLTPDEVEDLERTLQGNFEGIGARMTIRQNQPAVAETFPNSPARQAGLKRGDILLEVDGKPVAGLPVEKVAALVRGPAGTEVRLRAAREGQAELLDLKITRARVDIPMVSWGMLPGTDVAHVAVREFGGHADEQLKAAIVGARAKGAKGLVVDLRGNPGGLKEQAVKVTSQFLDKGTIFIEQNAQGERTAIGVEPGGTATDLPLAVLIDEGSASSAEIFAGAIQDHKRGRLVGKKTFGTGTVLQQFLLTDRSSVMLAVAQWFTPDGRKIWHQGITPDVEVKLAETSALLSPEEAAELTAAAFAQSRDAQLLRAVEELKK